MLGCQSRFFKKIFSLSTKKINFFSKILKISQFFHKPQKRQAACAATIKKKNKLQRLPSIETSIEIIFHPAKSHQKAFVPSNKHKQNLRYIIHPNRKIQNEPRKNCAGSNNYAGRFKGHFTLQKLKLGGVCGLLDFVVREGNL